MLAICRRALCTGRAASLASLRTDPGHDRVRPETVSHNIGFSCGLHDSAKKALPPWLGRRRKQKKASPRFWSEEECSRLLAMRKPDHPWKAMLEYFPGRTAPGLAMKYFKLQAALQHVESRPERKSWTPEELRRRNALRAQGLSWPQVAQQMPGRSVYAVKHAHRRPLTLHRHTVRRWTAAEVAKLQNLVKIFGTEWEEIARRMPRRTMGALVAKHWSLVGPAKLTRFTQAESRLIFELKSQGCTSAQIAEKLPGSTKDTIRAHVDSRRYAILSPDRVFRRKWTPADDAQLVQMRTQGKTWREIRETLGKTCSAGIKRLRAMKRDDLVGLRATAFHPRKWTAEEDLRLRAMREQGLTWKKIAEELGSSEAAVLMRHRRIIEREQSDPDPS